MSPLPSESARRFRPSNGRSWGSWPWRRFLPGFFSSTCPTRETREPTPTSRTPSTAAASPTGTPSTTSLPASTTSTTSLSSSSGASWSRLGFWHSSSRPPPASWPFCSSERFRATSSRACWPWPSWGFPAARRPTPATTRIRKYSPSPSSSEAACPFSTTTLPRAPTCRPACSSAWPSSSSRSPRPSLWRPCSAAPSGSPSGPGGSPRRRLFSRWAARPRRLASCSISPWPEPSGLSGTASIDTTPATRDASPFASPGRFSSGPCRRSYPGTRSRGSPPRRARGSFCSGLMTALCCWVPS